MKLAVVANRTAGIERGVVHTPFVDQERITHKIGSINKTSINKSRLTSARTVVGRRGRRVVVHRAKHGAAVHDLALARGLRECRSGTISSPARAPKPEGRGAGAPAGAVRGWRGGAGGGGASRGGL